MNEPLVSVIVLNYNGLEYLKECYESLEKQTYKNFESFLVDNNSEDGSVNVIKSNFKKVKIVNLDKNYGFAKGNNLCIPHTKGEYIVLLNMDTVVDPNWLRELVKVAQKSKKTGIVGGKIFYNHKKEMLNFAGGSTDKYGNTRHIGAKTIDNYLFDKKMNVFYICGASLLIKRELIKKMNLFDPTYFMYYEDVDLCWRALIYGYDVIFNPKSFIYHKIDTLKKNMKKNKFLREKHILRTFFKNYEFKTLIRILPNYFLIRFFSVVKYKNKKFTPGELLFMYLRVILWNLSHIGSLIYERRKIQKNRIKNDRFLLKFMENLEKYAIALKKKSFHFNNLN